MKSVVTTPDVYSPLFNNGSYTDHEVDAVWLRVTHPNGVRCMCHPNPSKTFTKAGPLKQHLRTKRHARYIKVLGKQYADPLSRLLNAEECIRQQQRIITALSNENERLQLRVNQHSSVLQRTIRSLQID